MIEDLGICKGPGNLLCKMRVGQDQLHLSKNGKMYYASLNNRIIASALTEKDLFSKNLPFLVSLIKEMGRKAGLDQMRWLPTTDVKKDNKMISDAMKYVRENLHPAEMFVLKLVPDEIQDQLPKEAAVKRNTVSGLREYQNNLKEIQATVSGIRETSDILLKTVLAKQMWGSKDVMDIISSNRTAMADISSDFDKADICFEKSDSRARFIQASFERKIATQQVKEVVGEIIKDFSFLKSFMSRLAQDLRPLYAIDSEFKTRVGYPATWFFNPTTFMDFTDGYESLVRHVIKSASMESEIFEPLLLWRVTNVG